MITGEHEFEVEYGLPEALPRGERLLWQGSPDGATLAREATHWRKLAIYFGVLLLWRAENVIASGNGLMQALVAAAWLLPLAAFAIVSARMLATLIHRTTVYTLTDRRVVMRIGIVLTMTLNLPLRQIDGAALRAGKDGFGDIALTLGGEARIGYLHLWPHARPWRLRATQPMLRALPDAARVASLISDALQATTAAAVRPSVVEVPSLRQPVLHAVRLPVEREPRAA